MCFHSINDKGTFALCPLTTQVGYILTGPQNSPEFFPKNTVSIDGMSWPCKHMQKKTEIS